MVRPGLGVKAGHSGVEEMAVESTENPEYHALRGAASMEVSRGRYLYVVYIAAFRQGRVQPIRLVTDDNGLYTSKMAEVQSILESVHFLPRSKWPEPVPAGSTPPHPYRVPKGTPQPDVRADAEGAPRVAAKDDLVTPSFTWDPIQRPTGKAGIDGIYTALLIHTDFMHSWIEPGRDYYVFFPDGRALQALPEEGLESYNWDYWHEENPMFFGHYVMRGSVGDVDWDGGGGSTGLQKTSEGLLIGGKGPFRRLDPCDGLTLEGTYKRVDWKTAYAKDAFITFHKDGTFEEKGTLSLASAMWWRPGKGYRMEGDFPGGGDDKLAGSGTYTIGNYSLTLLYRDGRKRRINFHLAEGSTASDPKAFRINTWAFLRQ
jgi:hypothetical protein